MNYEVIPATIEIPKKVLQAQARDMARLPADAIRDNIRRAKNHARKYIQDHRIPNVVPVIHGESGPVAWPDLRQHPKIRSRGNIKNITR